MSYSLRKALCLTVAVLMAAAMLAAFSAPAYAADKPDKAKITSLKKSDANKVELEWDKAKDAKKYEVKVKDGTTGFIAYVSTSKTSLTFQGGSGVRYTFNVRGINGKKQGKWSATKVISTYNLVKAAQKRADEAEEALAQAEADLEEAQTAQADAEAERDDALFELEDVKEKLAEALDAQKEAEEELAEALAGQAEAEEEKNEAVQAKAEADKAKEAALAAKEQAEKDKKAAEDAKAQAVADKEAAVAAKAQADADKEAAVAAKAQADADKEAALSAKAQAEADKAQADADKAQALTDKAKAESDKAEALTAKSKAESDRAEALAAQAAAEQALSEAETALGQANADKAEAQAAKEQAEADKAQAEKDLEAAEKRAADADKKVADLEKRIKELEEKYNKLFAESKSLALDTWNPEVKDALNRMIKANAGKENKYAVFDFDNTCSIFDVEELLAAYQLQVMAFDESIDAARLEEILKTGLNPRYFTERAPASNDYCGNADATYQDWIDDITTAYQKLLDKGYQFTPAGLSAEDQAKIQVDDDWKEFATKMRTMYDVVFDSESADIAYPWVLYWFTGMTEEEVYQLAKASHSKYKNASSEYITWETEGTGTKVGNVAYKWISGTQVSENILELMAALDNNGIDVWVCSASATDPIRAAIDVWGLHDHVTGLMAMTNKVSDGVYVNEYDYDTGCAWLTTSDGKWQKGTAPTKAQTQGKGKVTAIQNVCVSKYGCGPVAGFMDSTGDFNFCTEFDDLEVVCCFNRATRKVTDGGGLVSEVAVYQADTLYGASENKYAAAKAAGDTLYVLQGREENGFRGLRPARETIRLDRTEPELFKNENNTAQLQYMIDNNMSVEDIMNRFSIKTAADDSGNPLGFKFGFLNSYDGYHSLKYGSGSSEATTLQRDDWNPEVKDALNEMIEANKGKQNKYAVFDFDNTCSIFDVEEQLIIYQLLTMSFDDSVDADKLRAMLSTELNQEYFTNPLPFSTGYCTNANSTYQDWIDDIVSAYQKLLDKGYSICTAGLNEEDQARIHQDDDWIEFATKMRAMYDLVFDTESASVAYPWVLYWFTGMTHKEVYDIAYASHSYFKELDSTFETWSTDGTGSKVGAVEIQWTSGTQVPENINELMAALDNNGIDVWICSASGIDQIRAAVDVWGLHDHVTGVMAMTNRYEDNAFVNQYDYTTGYAWLPQADGTWKEGNLATEAQTQGAGKVTAIQNVCTPQYGCGPIAGFMDSTGDFNFCTEFEDLEVVCCFNRANRKVIDGGGLISELAVYQADTLYKDAESKYEAAKTAGDTLYVIQGREENGLRELRPSRETVRLGKADPALFRNEDNVTQLEYMISNNMTVEEILNGFSVRKVVGEGGNPFEFKIGFLLSYDGYHSK